MTKLQELMAKNGIESLKKQNTEDSIEALREQNQILLQCILQMSEIVYA